MMAGDVIGALVGGAEPFVQRPTGTMSEVFGSNEWLRAGDEYWVIGGCQLGGAMNGELLNDGEEDWRSLIVVRKDVVLENIVVD
jgi:hypothetical protein